MLRCSALLAHHQHARDQVVDVAKAAGVLAAALDRERQRALGMRADRLLQAQGELRNDVIETRVGSVDIVRPKDQHPFEMLAPIAIISLMILPAP
jgi:hypothetical protein